MVSYPMQSHIVLVARHVHPTDSGAVAGRADEAEYGSQPVHGAGDAELGNRPSRERQDSMATVSVVSPLLNEAMPAIEIRNGAVQLHVHQYRVGVAGGFDPELCSSTLGH